MPTFETLDLGKLVVRHQEAREFIERIGDENVREAVRFALFRAMSRFMRLKGQTNDEFLKQLPKSPFDVMFFAEVTCDTLAHTERIVGILQGERFEDF
jgi:hypothetical protein